MPLAERIEAAEERLYYCLTGLEHYALLLAAEAEAVGMPNAALRARLIAADTVSRFGLLDRAKEWELQLHAETGDWPALRRRVEVMLATTCERRGERAESMGWISQACADWPEADRPAWRAEALMVFALLSASRRHVDYSLARHAVVAVEAHCSPLLRSVTLANFAEVAADCADLAIATEFAARAVATLDEYPEVAVPLTLDSIALAWLAVDKTDAAIEILERALQLERHLGCSDVQGDPWLSMSQALLMAGDVGRALEFLDHPRRADWAAKCTWTRSRDRKQRALILARLHRWEEAFTALLDHVEIYESVRSIEGDRATAESETIQIANEERRRAARFEKLALTDTLTGLPNRRQVDLWLNARGAALDIAIIDLDHFKRVNDTYSHAAGDLVLQHIAEILQAGMLSLTRDGSGSRVGRLGGEEFIVIWMSVDPDSVTAHANGLLDHIRQARFPEIEPSLVITASIGLAFHRPQVSGSLLLAEADRSLYIAKDSGRDRVVFAGPKEISQDPGAA
ncbi:MAG TPA: GGDEF domain-containing protein [Kineosporiaceae bacterium]|nr:GGDEF domain-containing protein [Kineosporiaceae bacterium]